MIAYLRAENRLWTIPDGPSSIGSREDCTLVLDVSRYPNIADRHATLMSRDGVVRFRSEKSGGGVLLNGVLLPAGELIAGDVFELGPGGPRLEIRRPTDPRPSGIGVPSYAGDMATRTEASAMSLTKQPAAADRTQMMPVAGSSGRTPLETVVQSQPGYTPASPSSKESRTVALPGYGSQAAASAVDTTAVTPQAALRAVAGPSDAATRELNENVREMLRCMDELESRLNSKLGLARNLLAGACVAIVALLGLMAYQNSELGKTREDVIALQKQAASSVSLLMPQLDQRMQALDQRLNQIDPQLQKSEDHMVERMNKDLPLLMDKYMAQRMQTMQGIPGMPALPSVPGKR